MENVIDLTEDDNTGADAEHLSTVSNEEDEDLKLAIALSLQDRKSDSPSTIRSPISFASQQPEPPAKPQSSLLGLDRKAMEAERLARLKRKRSDTGDDAGLDIGHSSASKRRPAPCPPLKHTIYPPSTDTRAAFIQPRSKHRAQPQIDSPFSFCQGKVLLTASPSRFSPAGSLGAISFPDILKPPPSPSPSASPYVLKSALLSSFIADFDWVFPHFTTSGPASIKFVLVLHAQDPRHRQLLRADFEGVKTIRLVMPEIAAGGFGTMHSKLMLLFFAADEEIDSKVATTAKREICRLVVPSANLVPYDWGVGGVMENVLYVIDLPSKQQRHQLELDSDSVNMQETAFETQLKRQLSAMGVPTDVLRKLSSFDFTATRDTGFIHTISSSTPLHPNTSLSQNAQKMTMTTGLLSLSDTIASLGLSITPTSPAYPPQIDFITSSLGNLSPAFLRQLQQAVCGKLDPSIPPSLSTTKRGRTTKQQQQNINSEQHPNLDDTIKRNLRIYFPSAQTVRASKGGIASAGTICFQKKWWDDNDLIRECMRDCVGVRGDGILMHSKILYVSFGQPLCVESTDGTAKSCLGWVYIGSANFSESAWGRITSDVKTKVSKLTARNWESGVVLPIFADTTVSSPWMFSNQHSARCPKEQPHTSGETSSRLGRTILTSAENRSGVEETDGGDASLSRRLKPEKEGENAIAGDNACSVTGKLNTRHHAGKDNSEQHFKSLAKGRHMLHMDDASSKDSSAISEAFDSRIPIPLRMPAPSLVEVGLQPWYFKE